MYMNARAHHNINISTHMYMYMYMCLVYKNILHDLKQQNSTILIMLAESRGVFTCKYIFKKFMTEYSKQIHHQLMKLESVD